MLFNSFVFPVFFLIVWGLYLVLKHRPQNFLLLVASYVFYGWWDWRFLSLLFISTITDYVIAQAIFKCRPEQKRLRTFYLIVSLVCSLGILGFFKYFNFFADSAVSFCSLFGFQADVVTLNILLPVGISFYTFQTMAYTIDVYRGQETPCRNFVDFALYVSFFPQLVAGPIERSTRLIPQIAKPRNLDAVMIQSGVQLIFWGYFKKVFIADGVAPYVNMCFSEPSTYNGVTLLLGAYLFAIQIYGDFSGYTDIARGVSRLFGIELCVNFRQPYLASNITDFWRRWHISLSTWLRDYLYIPLGGNRKGPRRTYINNMLTMLLGGLWHGAAWTFVIWGGLHGLFLAVHKFFLGKRTPQEEVSFLQKTPLQRLRYVLCVLATFHLVCFVWIFFRAETLFDAIAYIQGIFFATSTEKISGISTVAAFYIPWVLFIDISCQFHKSEVPVLFNNPRFPLASSVVRGLIYAVALFFLVYVGGDHSEPFIYFQF